jgi:hypothetical protein
MRQSLATTFSLTCVPAVAIGLVLMPLVTSAVAAAPETGGASATPSASPPPAIELQQDEASKASQCAAQPCPTGPEVASERAYLVTTAHPGGTMMRQGPELAISRLHPEFAARLAAAIREARASGLPEAGIFSAYRPPAFGVGGFKDKFHSLHSYGLAVDMQGIGAPGSSEARLWRSIAAKHGVTCPYGVDNKAEWNHCQPTSIKMVRSDSPLVKTIKAEGPVNPLNMFEAGKDLIESVAKLLASFGGAPGSTQIDNKVATIAAHRGRRVLIADAGSVRQRNERQRVAGKGQKTRPVRTAASGKAVRTASTGKTVRTAVTSKTHMARQAGHGARKGREG